VKLTREQALAVLLGLQAVGCRSEPQVQAEPATASPPAIARSAETPSASAARQTAPVEKIEAREVPPAAASGAKAAGSARPKEKGCAPGACAPGACG
jgi:hypothetical protein